MMSLTKLQAEDVASNAGCPTKRWNLSPAKSVLRKEEWSRTESGAITLMMSTGAVHRRNVGQAENGARERHFARWNTVTMTSDRMRS